MSYCDKFGAAGPKIIEPNIFLEPKGKTKEFKNRTVMQSTNR